MTRNFTFFIATSSWHKGAAVPTHFKSLADELVKRGHKVIILISGSKDLEKVDDNPEIRVWPSRRPTTWRGAWFLAKLIHQNRPHCLIANFGAVNVMMMIGWAMKVPVRIAYYHTFSKAIDIDAKMPTWKVNISRYCKRFIYKLCTHICPVSIAAQKDIANVYGVPITKTYVMYNSLPDPIINISKLQKNRNFIVCVGRLDRCKGQDILIKSLSILKDRVSKLQVKFIGEGMLKDELQNMAYKFGISEQCIFTGALTHDEVLHQISESGITIVPSRSEAFGNVCIESLAVGTPVVASSVGGIPEIIRDGIDGYLVPPEDPKALANAIVNLLNMNDEEYRQMCLNARQRFLEKFEQNKVIKEQASWFESIVSGALRNE